MAAISGVSRKKKEGETMAHKRKMMTAAQENAIQAFLAGVNCIRVSSPAELSKFRELLFLAGLDQELKTVKKKFGHWPRLLELGRINNRKDPSLFLFEYTYGKGITWSDDPVKAEEWFGAPPIVL